MNLCIDYIRRHRLNVRLNVFHMDYEIQYKMTIDYIDRIFEEHSDILNVYRICVPFRVSTCVLPCIRHFGVLGKIVSRSLGASDARELYD